MDTVRGEIDWARIGRAVEFYKRHGFRYIETPWTVPVSVVGKTYAGDEYLAAGDGGSCLVGSAEQGFIHLMETGQLPASGNFFVSVSPCFRPGDSGPYSFPDFVKVELFSTVKSQWNKALMGAAVDFFLEECPWMDLTDVGTDLGSDLQIRGIEIGSYGPRESEGFEWSCGTGLAEPRFSMALDRALRRE